MDSMLSNWYVRSIIINSFNALCTSMKAIELPRNTSFLSSNISNLKRSSLPQNCLIPNPLSKCKLSRIIQSAMGKLASVGANRKTWNYKKEVYRVETIKAQICGLSLLYIVRCRESLNDSTLASCELTCNQFARRYV